MKFYTSISLLLVLLFTQVSYAQKGKKAPSILFTNGYLHYGNGQIMESATIGVVKDEITLIKSSLSYNHKVSDWDTIVDLKGKHVYPGIIAPNSTLGLTEIDAVRSTRDYDEVGEFNPHIRALIAYNVESDVISTVRTNGVLITQITPRGGWVTGSSSLMHLDGWNWEDAAIVKDDGIHVNWPSAFPGRGAAVTSAEETKRKNQYAEHKRALFQFFEMAEAYANNITAEIPELRMEAMKECFKGGKRVFFHANDIQQLLDVIDFSRHFKLKFPVIVGGYDSYLILPQLRDAEIPVMLPRVHSLPDNENDAIDLPYQLPALLKKGGVKFCLQNEGDMEAMNARNIPFLAGHTMGFGLSEEEALMTVTLNTCEILGIDKEYGSIEVGKKATLFVSTGPALDMRTNNVVMALMNGEWVNLDNRQKDLYDKYKKKYQNQ